MTLKKLTPFYEIPSMAGAGPANHGWHMPYVIRISTLSVGGEQRFWQCMVLLLL